MSFSRIDPYDLSKEIDRLLLVMHLACKHSGEGLKAVIKTISVTTWDKNWQHMSFRSV